MEQPHSEFGLLVKPLLEDLERTRRAWPQEASEEEIQKHIRERIQSRIPELWDEFFPAELQTTTQLSLYKREIDQLLVPRYARLAKAQNVIELNPIKPLQGSDLYNRMIYTGFFVLLGIFVVWAPFIPIWDKAIPFFLGGIAFFASPFLPNLHQIFLKKQHEEALHRLFSDLDQAGLALPEHVTEPQEIEKNG